MCIHLHIIIKGVGICMGERVFYSWPGSFFISLPFPPSTPTRVVPQHVEKLFALSSGEKRLVWNQERDNGRGTEAAANLCQGGPG